MHGSNSPQKTTFSMQGVTDLVLRHLPEVKDTKRSDMEFGVRVYFNPFRGRERVTINDLLQIKQQVAANLERAMTKSNGFNESAQEAAKAVSAAFATTFNELVQDPQAAEPKPKAKVVQPARPNVPREMVRPVNMEKPVSEAAAERPVESLRPVKTEAVKKQKDDAQKPPRQPKPVKATPLKRLPPEGWLGMVTASRAIDTWPITMQAMWHEVVASAEKETPDAAGICTVKIGEGTVRMFLKGKETWYMEPAGIQGPFKQEFEARRAASSSARAERRSSKPVAKTTDRLVAPSDWMSMVGMAKAVRTTPKIAHEVLGPLIEAAAQSEPDDQGIRTVPYRDTTVRMLFGGLRMKTWYMHPDDVKGAFKQAVEEKRNEAYAKRSANTAGMQRPTKHVHPVPPAGWQGRSKAAQMLGLKPQQLTESWDALVASAEQATPDEHGVRTVTSGDTTVRMMYGAESHRPYWHMHPDDIAGPYKTILPVAVGAKHAQPPEKWRALSVLTHDLGAVPDELRMIWRGLVAKAEQHEPNSEGRVEFTEPEGTVRMCYGGLHGKPTWYIEPESCEQVLLPRYNALHARLHRDHGHRAVDQATLPAKPSAPRTIVMPEEEKETSLRYVGRLKQAKAERIYEIDEQSRFEVSSVVDLTLKGVSGSVPPSVAERLQREVNRVLAPFKERSTLTKGDFEQVIAVCKTNAANRELPNESKEVYRVVATAMENALPHLNTLEPIVEHGNRAAARAQWASRVQPGAQGQGRAQGQ